MGNFLKSMNSKTGNMVSTLKFIDSKWTALPNIQTEFLGKNEISFMTYNVWFEGFNWDGRLKALSELFEKYDPDFLCLQEVTDAFLDYLMNLKFIQEKYYISGNFKGGYDVLILSKYQTCYYSEEFPTNMYRNLLFTVLKLNEKEELIISTAHFESLDSEKTRKKQLEITFNIINNYGFAFLMGDFNFDPSWKEQSNIDPDYTDSWQLYCKNNLIEESSGFTMPANKRFKAWRPDRLLFRPQDKIEMNDFEIIGKNKIIDCPGYVETPSDHYGLYGKYKINF